MESKARIPVIDFSSYALDKIQCDSKEELAEEIVQAFSTIGFVYLQNHGICDRQITEAFKVSDDFFNLSEDVKCKYQRGTLSQNHGWLKIGGENIFVSMGVHYGPCFRFDDRPADYKECYDVNPPLAQDWPDTELPSFRDSTIAFYDSCRQLSRRLLELMAIGLKLKDPSFFTSRHNPERFTLTALRYLHYPPLPALDELPEGQLRCGEHTDYGSVTLLFQDDVGGLEVYDREVGYVPAPPIPGTIVVNLGDLMQRWTADQLLSTRHRVLNPSVPGRRRRRSVVCFVHPDADCMIECIDSSNKYQPITAEDYITKRFSETLVVNGQ